MANEKKNTDQQAKETHSYKTSHETFEKATAKAYKEKTTLSALIDQFLITYINSKK